MRITITTTLDVSQANEALIPIVAESIGYTEGDIEEFIKTKLAEMNKSALIQLIEPCVRGYFGRVMSDTADAVALQLHTAVDSNVDITREEEGS